MNRYLCFILVILAFGCAKAKTQIESNILLDMITSSQWKVTSLQRDTSEKSGCLNPYVFQFHKDNTVDAISGSSLVYTGQWQGDVGSKTVTTLFTCQDSCILQLNGPWQITHATTSYVIATQSRNGSAFLLRLDKK